MAKAQKPGASRPDPRVEKTREKVLQAALEALLDEGPEAVTAASVHERTGVARTTIYRHWPTQLNLVLSTLDRLTFPATVPARTDDWQADLHRMLTHLKRRMERRRVREMVAATLTVAVAEPGSAEMARRFLDGLLAPIREVLHEAAQAAGMSPEASEDLYDRTVGPMLFRHVLMVGTIPPSLIDAVVAEAARCLGSAARAE